MKRLLETAYGARGARPDGPRPVPGPHWSADFFGLSRTSAWSAAPESARAGALARLSDSTLAESYWIERVGMRYASKMALLAGDADECQFFCLMAAEEAEHFRSLKPYFPEGVEGARAPSSFARLIGRVAEEGGRDAGLGLIQTLLEGWGLSYYRDLAEGCRSQGLRSAFVDILQDESRHHAAGVVLAKRQGGLRFDSFAQDALAELLSLVQCGPIEAAQAALEASGRLDASAAEEFMAEIGAEDGARARLKRLRSLLARVLDRAQLERVDATGGFEPFSTKEMARIAAS